MKLNPDNEGSGTLGGTGAKAGSIYAPNWRGSAWVIGSMAVGIAIGAGGLAMAAGMPGPGAWGHGPRLEMVQRIVHGALDSVGATTVQEGKVHDIVSAAFSDIERNALQRDAMRKQVTDLLRAPTIDRAAAETLRAEQIARMDAGSKKIVGAVLDAADQLTPEQRTKLADRFAGGGRRFDRGALAGPQHAMADHDMLGLGQDRNLDEPDEE